MIIKVCGMREEENIRQLEQIDIDWMGFIFYPGSSRFVGAKLNYLPRKIKRIGVFVNQDLQTVSELAKQNNLYAIQLHGSEPPQYCINLKKEGHKVIKSFGIAEDGFIPQAQLHAYEGKCNYFLFDTKTNNYGGSGKKFNWEMLSDYNGDTPFLLSGGISPDDVEVIKSIKNSKFAGVDVNSRFETEPAIKNIEKVRLFVEQLR